MVTDTKMVEQLVEIITHEVLAAMLEQKEQTSLPEGGSCKFNCTDGMCVRTCFDQAGNVVISYAAPHHLVADSALAGGTYSLRRSRAGGQIAGGEPERFAQGIKWDT